MFMHYTSEIYKINLNPQEYAYKSFIGVDRTKYTVVSAGLLRLDEGSYNIMYSIPLNRNYVNLYNPTTLTLEVKFQVYLMYTYK